MLALSIRQPWASLIIAGIKDIENRTWPTEFRGRFIIHTGKLFDESYYRSPILFLNQLNDRYGLELDLYETEHLPRGGIVGQAELVDCVTQSDSEWFEGPYGFVIQNPMELRFRPCSGLIRFFDVMPPLEASVKRLTQPLFNVKQGVIL